MNCERCGLPIDDEHPFGEYVAHDEFHDILTCVEALKAALAEAQKPSVAAIYGYEAGRNEASCRIAELEAERAELIRKLKARVKSGMPPTPEMSE